MEKLQLLLEKIVRLEKADKGNIQIYDAREDRLKILVHFGFEESLFKTFSMCKAI